MAKLVKLDPIGQEAAVKTNDNLLSGLLKNDLNVMHECGGRGMCSTSQSEAKFIEQLKAEMQSLDSKAFRNGAQNVISIWKRDVKHTLRSSAAAMLINDLDRLREGFLLWHRTIVHVFQVEDIAQLTYQVMPEVIQQYLTPEEATLIMSALQLDQTLLS